MNENVVNSNRYSYLIVYIKCVDLIVLNPPALYAGQRPAYNMAPLSDAMSFLAFPEQSK